VRMWVAAAGDGYGLAYFALSIATLVCCRLDLISAAFKKLENLLLLGLHTWLCVIIQPRSLLCTKDAGGCRR